MAPTEPIRRPRTRAFTLIEVLVALGIVLALSLLVLPLSSWMFSLRALDSARDGVEAIILQSRAHARVSARAIEVRLSGDRLEASWFDPSRESFGSTEDVESLAIEEIDQIGLEDSMIFEPWARRRLPSEIEAVSWEDYLLRLEEIDGFESTWAEPLEEVEDVSMRLAILLPDGGAFVGDSIVLIGPEGNALRIDVDPWTGRPQIDVPPANVLDLPEEEELQEDELEVEEAPVDPAPESQPQPTRDRSEEPEELEEPNS